MERDAFPDNSNHPARRVARRRTSLFLEATSLVEPAGDFRSRGLMTLILGRKQGMTHVFREDGTHIGVTVVSAGPCTVTQVRTQEKDGYDAVQLGYADTTEKRTRKPLRGHFAKVGCAPKRLLREERLKAPAALHVGDTVTVAAFTTGDLVDVVGTTKGRGFAGTIKRHGFQRGPETHGSMNVRQPGSIASNFGHERSTMKNLEVVRVDPDRNLLFLRGAVPGPNGGFVQVSAAKTGIKKAPPPVAAQAKDKKK
jgi:large subunit ribosomal protein L3